LWKLPLLDSAARETGLDLRRDLWEVLVAAGREHTVAFARGRFAEQGLEPRVFGNARRTPYRGYTLLGTDQSALVFLTSSTIAAGPPAAVKWAIDERGRATGPPEALAEMIRGIAPENQMWLVAAEVPWQTPLAMADTVRAFAYVGTGAQLTAEFTSAQPEQIHGALTLLAGLSGIKAEIQRQERTVKLSVSLSDQQLDKLLAGGI
jgi:hypothetical protein